jgi:hypothetical protein
MTILTGAFRGVPHPLKASTFNLAMGISFPFLPNSFFSHRPIIQCYKDCDTNNLIKYKHK